MPSLTGDLARVEVRLREEVSCDLEFLSDVALHLIDAGGKRIRPALTLVSASLAHAVRVPEAHAAAVAASEAVIAGATAVELVHLGSLYHDDVMDSASTRRNVSSVNERWDNLTAILAGDFLLARASHIAASLGIEVTGLLAETIGSLCEGQIREHQDTFRVDRTKESYELSIWGKTAALLAASCRVGGIVAGLPAEAIDALGEFGRGYGMAFQIVDDVLDVVATDEQLGKPAGADLAEGNYTLPVILALSTPGGEELCRILDSPSPRSADETTRATEIILSSGSVREALAEARRWAARADAATDSLPSCEATEALRLASSFLFERLSGVDRGV